MGVISKALDGVMLVVLVLEMFIGSEPGMLITPLAMTALEPRYVKIISALQYPLIASGIADPALPMDVPDVPPNRSLKVVFGLPAEE